MHLTSYVIVVQGGQNGGLKRMAYNVQIMQYYSCSASQKDFCIPGPQRNFFSCHASGNEKAFLHTNFFPTSFPFSLLPSPVYSSPNFFFSHLFPPLPLFTQPSPFIIFFLSHPYSFEHHVPPFYPPLLSRVLLFFCSKSFSLYSSCSLPPPPKKIPSSVFSSTSVQPPRFLPPPLPRPVPSHSPLPFNFSPHFSLLFLSSFTSYSVSPARPIPCLPHFPFLSSLNSYSFLPHFLFFVTLTSYSFAPSLPIPFLPHFLFLPPSLPIPFLPHFRFLSPPPFLFLSSLTSYSVFP